VARQRLADQPAGVRWSGTADAARQTEESAMSTQSGSTRIKFLAGVGATVVLCALASPEAQADTVLFQQWPAVSRDQADSINQSNFTSDDFTLAAAATLDKVVFEEAELGNETPASVKWYISSGLFGKNPIALGTASLTATLTSAGTSGNAFSLFTATFSLPNVSLAAGKYYLTLNNGQNVPPTGRTAGNLDYWAIHATPGDSQTFQSVQVGNNVYTQTFMNHDEDAFQIYGTAGSGGGGGGGGGKGVPEPQTLWLLAAGALLTLGLARRRWSVADYTENHS